ncbi:KEOPS complex subunit Pcc1 [Cuniculiplasma sp. SKW3]|uniref:KEOPS complex subunit Pcc1 n=1 Tax=Cuniculiplasma sp. SKW3 TaxID=3400170 RepID=UPI003FCFA87D
MNEDMTKIRVSIKFDMSNWMQILEVIRYNIDEETGRSNISLSVGEDSFIIYIEALDTGAVRAAVGSITKWVNLAEQILDGV